LIIDTQRLHVEVWLITGDGSCQRVSGRWASEWLQDPRQSFSRRAIRVVTESGESMSAVQGRTEETALLATVWFRVGRFAIRLWSAACSMRRSSTRTSAGQLDSTRRPHIINQALMFG